MRKQMARPVMRTVLKNIRTGQTKEHTFKQSDKVEEADVTRRAFKYLYERDGQYAFMDDETYEQLELDHTAVGSVSRFLLEGETAQLVMFEDEPVGVELPIKIERRVIAGRERR
jgi:elongation factor P